MTILSSSHWVAAAILCCLPYPCCAEVKGPKDGSASAEVAVDHWAFKPPHRPTLPWVMNSKWVRNEIDTFISAEHEERRLQPSPEADRRVLIRRLSLDLLGLPPTIEE